MVRTSISVSLPPDLGATVKAYGADGNNISGLVCRLLRAYFGQGGDPKMAGVAVSEIEGRISSLREELEQATADLSALKGNLEEKTNTADAEKAAALDDDVRASIGDPNRWVEVARRQGAIAAAGYISTRIGNIAARQAVPVDEARAAVLRIYPDLEDYL